MLNVTFLIRIVTILLIKHKFLIKHTNFADLPWDDLVIEIEKCDVLCANCHRRTHYKDKEK